MNSNKSKILLIGSQGSGKSTQSKLLSKYLSVPFIETGTILRNLSEEETASGIEIKERLSKGEMVSDDIVAELVEKRLKEKGCGLAASRIGERLAFDSVVNLLKNYSIG